MAVADDSEKDALAVATPVAEHASMDSMQLLTGPARDGRSCAVLPHAMTVLGSGIATSNVPVCMPCRSESGEGCS